MADQGNNTTDVATTSQELASIFVLLEKYEEAAKLYKNALSIFKSILGDIQRNILNTVYIKDDQLIGVPPILSKRLSTLYINLCFSLNKSLASIVNDVLSKSNIFSSPCDSSIVTESPC